MAKHTPGFTVRSEDNKTLSDVLRLQGTAEHKAKELSAGDRTKTFLVFFGEQLLQKWRGGSVCESN